MSYPVKELRNLRAFIIVVYPGIDRIDYWTKIIFISLNLLNSIYVYVYYRNIACDYSVLHGGTHSIYQILSGL